ncbi:MAG: trypsin-like peptidase domain-containing protein [Planctomycetes bacterium]|nr:trypsin-like peptidase domain-containing protein [Planctomycetota bacterium]
MNTDENIAPPAIDHPHAIPMATPVFATPRKRNTAERIAGGLWNWVLPVMFLLSLTVLVIYTAPYLIYHWRLLDAQADAEATFLKRRAELKAEAEHADARLDLLDKRVHLTSLGFEELARKVSPVVVNVVSYREPTETDLEEAKFKKLPMVYDPDDDRKYLQNGVGSGLIYKPGIILTNHHVIRRADRLRVQFPSGRSIGIDASVVVSDIKTDLAVIRLPENLSPAMKEEAQNAAEFADSDKDVRVGRWVLAMGSPLGLKHTVTHGIISAKGRLITAPSREEDLIELLQTDAAINPGNSGGPLFDQLGRVVGINAMIASDTGRAQGIGFAIPSNTARRVAEHLLTNGEVPRGFLGIFMEEVPPPDAKKLKIDGGAVAIKRVERGSAAEKAGLLKDDLILRINKEPLERLKAMRHLRQLVSDLDPGTEISIEILRGDERRQITLTLGKRPANVP